MRLHSLLAPGLALSASTASSHNASSPSSLRVPALRHAEPAWGTPMPLFNGKDLSGWHATGTNQWTVVNGMLTSAKPGSNLLTDKVFTDVKLHVEFRVPKGGISGIYLRGRHEVQVEDSKGIIPRSSIAGW